MLRQLHIRDFAIIDELSLEFAAGFNVLTGETGAGKSIILDSLMLALGGRADRALIRAGADQASVTATFTLGEKHAVWPLLAEAGLEAEPSEPLILRRTIGANGQSRAFINDGAVSVQLLKSVGEMLVEFHGQGDEQGLMDARGHRALLDAYGALGAFVAATLLGDFSAAITGGGRLASALV